MAIVAVLSLDFVGLALVTNLAAWTCGKVGNFNSMRGNLELDPAKAAFPADLRIFFLSLERLTYHLHISLTF